MTCGPAGNRRNSGPGRAPGSIRQYGVGRSPHHVWGWIPGPPGPPLPRILTISGRLTNHVFKTQVYARVWTLAGSIQGPWFVLLTVRKRPLRCKPLETQFSHYSSAGCCCCGGKQATRQTAANDAVLRRHDPPDSSMPVYVKYADHPRYRHRLHHGPQLANFPHGKQN